MEPIEALIEKLEAAGEHEAVGKAKKALDLYAHTDEFVRAEFPHWSEDDKQVKAMDWALKLV